MRPALSFRMLGQVVRIECDTQGVEHLVRVNFAGLPGAEGFEPDLSYAVHRESGQEGYALWRNGVRVLTATSHEDVLFQLEGDLTVEVQQRRPDLLHLRAAAVEYQGHAWLLVGDADAGKTTAAWELVHHGFRLVSDKFSSVDIGLLKVYSRPDALRLRFRPPGAYRRPPRSALDLGHVVYIPATAVPTTVAGTTISLAGLVFLQHEPVLREPILHTLSAAEASARLYVNTLNALAHPNCGVDAAVAVAGSLPCWLMFTAGLDSTARLLQGLARSVPSA